MARSTAWFLAAYFLCALTAWSNMLPVPTEPDLVFLINGLHASNTSKWYEVDWGSLDEGSSKWVPYFALQQFVNLIHPPGAVLVGVLFDRIGARRCYMICLLSGVAQHALRSGAWTMGQLYLSKVPLIFRHTYLVTRTLIMQETSEEGRTRALAHAGIAHGLGSAMGLAAGGMGVEAKDYHGGAVLATLISFTALAVSFCLTCPSPAETPVCGTSVSPTRLGRLGGSFEPGLSPSRSPKQKSLLPTPVAMLAWPTSREGLAKLLSRPVVFLLVAAKIGDSVASSMQDLSLGRAQASEIKDMAGFEPNLVEGYAFWTMAAQLCLIGPCTRKFTPRSFILMCLGYQVVSSLGVAAMLGSGRLLAGTLPGEQLVLLLRAIVNVHYMASMACGTVLTTLLASAIVREERGTILGLDNAFFLLPPLASPSLSSALYDLGGAGAAYLASFLLYLAIWFMIRKYVLPRYHEKSG